MCASVLKSLAPSDFSEVEALLQECQLFATDIQPADMPHFFGRRQNGALVAVGGIEPFGAEALLRSVATASSVRGMGYANDTVAALERYACERGVRALYLLTESADSFFARLGYTAIARGDVPASVRATRQFSALCPASAVCMAKQF